MSAEARYSLLIPALAALGCLVQISIFRWGVVTPDSVVQYGQALSGQYDDWHPPITAWIWRQLLRARPGGAGFLVLDALLYWAGFALIADAVRKLAGLAAGVAILCIAILPIGFGEVGALLKDTLMACLLLMATALLMRGWTVGRIGAVGLIVVAAATRFNALFAAIPLLVLAAPVRFTRRPLPIAALALVAGLALFASNWAINVAALRPNRSQPFLSLVNFDLAGIIAHGGANGYPALNDAEAAQFTAHCYEPRLYGALDGEGCARPEDSIAEWTAEHGESAVGVWFNAILTSPGAYFAHRLDHLNWNWRVAPTAIPDDAVYVMSEPNSLGLHFDIRPSAKLVSQAAFAMARSPFGRPIVWMLVAAGLLIASPYLRERRFVTALAASSLLYGLGYALVSVASDLRYHLWTMLAAQIALVVALLTGRRRD